MTASAESSVQAKNEKRKKRYKVPLFLALDKETRASLFPAVFFPPFFPHCTVYQILSKKTTREKKWTGLEPTYSMCEQ